jgi:tetratricopeptide (TPR) repeat protein
MNLTVVMTRITTRRSRKRIARPGAIWMVAIVVFASSATLARADCDDDAASARATGDHDRAIQIMSDCVDEQLRKVADTYSQIGVTSFEKGLHKQAVEQYTQAIETAPAYANRGRSLAEMGKQAEAQADLNKAIELDDSAMQAYFYRGSLRSGNGRFSAAVADYARALELTDDRELKAQIHHERGIAHRELSQVDSALADYDAALELNPDYTDAYFARGQAYQAKNDTTAAIADFSKTLELEPDHAEAIYSRGLAHDQAGKDHLAVKDFNTAVALKPAFGRAHFQRLKVWLTPILPFAARCDSGLAQPEQQNT